MHLKEALLPVETVDVPTDIETLLSGEPIQCGDYRVHIAQTAEDAVAITRSIRSAWGLDAGAKYFYEVFNDPQRVFGELIVPALDAHEIKHIPNISVVVTDTEGSPLGTGSLVFDHSAHTIEFGRAGTLPEFQGNGVLKAATDARMLIASQLRAEYTLVSDSTTLTHAVQHRLHNHGMEAVAYHPSSFVIQKNRVISWQNLLAQKHSPQVVNALMSVSSRTGLGRFGTFFHILPTESLIDCFTPSIPEALRVFYTYTQKTLHLSDKGISQSITHKPQQTKDNPLTATRMICEPESLLQWSEVVAQARTDNFDTLIVQISCHAGNTKQLNKLLNFGFVPAGMFPDNKGNWIASFIYIPDLATRKATLEGLRVLNNVHFDALAIPENVQLASMVHKAMEQSEQPTFEWHTR